MADHKPPAPSGSRELVLDNSGPAIELEGPAPIDEQPAHRHGGVVAAREVESKWAAEPPPVVPLASFVRKPAPSRLSPTALVVATLLLVALSFAAHAAWKAWRSAATTAAVVPAAPSRPAIVDRVAKQLLGDGIAEEVTADESDPENATRASADVTQAELSVRSGRCNQTFADSLARRFSREMTHAGLSRVVCTGKAGDVYRASVAR